MQLAKKYKHSQVHPQCLVLLLRALDGKLAEPYRGQLRQLRARSDHPRRHDLRGGLGGISVQEPTIKRKYKYETKDIAVAAAKKRKNRARKDRRCRAKQHLTAAQKKKMHEEKMIQGRTKEQKIRAREQFRKEIKRTKQQRRRRQAINRQIWQELCVEARLDLLSSFLLWQSTSSCPASTAQLG